MSNLKITALSIGLLLIPQMVFAVGCTGGMVLVKSTDHPFGDCVRARNVMPSPCSAYKAPPGDISPDQIEGANLQLWVDATDPSKECNNTTSGNNPRYITTWKDKSGHGYDLSLSTGGVDTTGAQWVPNQVNDKPVLYFSQGVSLSDNLSGGKVLASITKDMTVFIVAETSTSTAPIISAGTTGIVTLPPSASTSAFGTATFAVGSFSTSNITSVAPGAVSTPPSSAAEAQVDIWTFNASQYATYGTSISQNGVVLRNSPGTLPVNPYSATTPLTVPGANWMGYIAEIIVYNTTLSDAEQEAVESYLSHKWGRSLPQATAPNLTVWLDASNRGNLTGTWNNVANSSQFILQNPPPLPASPPSVAISGASTGTLNGLQDLLLSTPVTLGSVSALTGSNYAVFAVNEIKYAPSSSGYPANILSCPSGVSIGYSGANVFQAVNINNSGGVVLADGAVANNVFLSMFNGSTGQVNYHVNGHDYNGTDTSVTSGCTSAQLGSSNMPTYFAEMQIYDTSTLSLTERQIANIEHSLKVKWGLQ